jgi:hypothetical protein
MFFDTNVQEITELLRLYNKVITENPNKTFTYGNYLRCSDSSSWYIVKGKGTAFELFYRDIPFVKYYDNNTFEYHSEAETIDVYENVREELKNCLNIKDVIESCFFRVLGARPFGFAGLSDEQKNDLQSLLRDYKSCDDDTILYSHNIGDWLLTEAIEHKATRWVLYFKEKYALSLNTDNCVRCFDENIKPEFLDSMVSIVCEELPYIKNGGKNNG